ncbi:MAG: phosphatidylserine decarboxylase [Gammaproteobacteria bacterium]|nr:phosphatidylserine decarboxylase [Gammaproteobacteria bacterium]NNM21453.1 phosphatidylserine decarboxylase [Gammaproteobacteria bacterium]
MDRIFATIQAILPQHLLTHCVGWLANSKLAIIRVPFIGIFRRIYRVDLAESDPSDPAAFDSFNAFFTRALQPAARTIARDCVIAPADGVISQCGTIKDGNLLQAKGQHYSVAQLLASDQEARAFDGGSFVTIYLAPHNYHRVHVPLAAQLRRMTFVPGRLFSVSPSTTRAVPGLFTRNERVVFHLDSDAGAVALVMVGAMVVGSVATYHAGIVRGREVTTSEYQPAVKFDHAQQLAQFNVGSTVIVLFAPGGPALEPGLGPGTVLQLGDAIAR